MAFDRDNTLKKAEKLLRQGKLDAAIVEYAKVVEDQPNDWNTTNLLGDLYGRASKPDKAAAQFSRIAEHFMREGFYPKAAALYKKVLKLNPEDEPTQLNLAELSQKQGLLADSKAYLNAIATRRRNRGDRAGAAEIVVRLGSLDPSDFDARTAAARMLVEMGDEEGAATRFRGIYDDLREKGRNTEALDALREAVRLSPYDQEGRVILAKAAVAAGDIEGARAYLDRETAGDDPVLLVALLEVELKSGQLDQARELIPTLLGQGGDQRMKLVELAWSTSESAPDAAFVLVEATVDHASAASEFSDAATILQEFVTRVPCHIPALNKLIEVCVDGGLESMMCDAQAQLADAYLAAGQATEGRVVAEDLVAREPWERSHIDRFRRALVMLKVSDPDGVIAERLSGESPFMATDPFAETGERSNAGEPGAAPADGAQPASSSPEGQESAARQPEPEAAQTENKKRPARSAKARKQEESGASFEEFHEEVSRQSGADQSAQHMTLARTYLEMGMQDEAINSLKMAARAPSLRFEAASLLGRTYRDREDTPQAIEWLERAAEAPAPGAEEGRALLYDLGRLVEQSGETARALAIFLELQSEAGEYRDVSERVERLARVETGG